MKLVYTVETKDWENIDSYPTLYNGDSLIVAMHHFKEAHLKGEDVVLFIEDENGFELDTITNYNNNRNDAVNCNELLKPTDKELAKQHKESVQQKEIYNNQYIDQLNKNTELNKTNERLQRENRELKQQINKLNEQKENKQENNIYWYEYRLRGFSPFCQPKDHIDRKENIGRHGIIAYNRQLTESELDEYELIPYKEAV